MENSKQRRARYSLAKAYYKELIKTREGLAGAWIDAEGRQCLCNGFAAVRYNNVYPDLQGNENYKDERINLDYWFKKPQTVIDIELDIQDLSTKAKEEHARAGKSSAKNGHILIKIGDYYFDAELLLPVLKTLTGELFYSFGQRLKFPPLYVFSKECEALILPVNVQSIENLRLIATIETN